MSKPLDLTAEQILNWRKILSSTMGFFAFMIPASDICTIAGMYQEKIDGLVPFKASSEFPQIIDTSKSAQGPTKCACDPSKIGTTTHLDGRITCNLCHIERK